MYLVQREMPAGRKSVACKSVGRPPELWCEACLQPKRKARCLIAGSAPSSSSDPRERFPFEVKLQLQVVADEDEARIVAVATLVQLRRARNQQRERNPPERLEAEDFWRYQLPDEPARMAVQHERTAALQQLADAALKESHDDGIKKGRQEANAIIADIQKRLGAMAAQLGKAKEESHRAASAERALRRQVEAGKRQKTLHAFFSAPLTHQARPCTTPEALGEGYTERNIASGLLS